MHQRPKGKSLWAMVYHKELLPPNYLQWGDVTMVDWTFQRKGGGLSLSLQFTDII